MALRYLVLTAKEIVNAIKFSTEEAFLQCDLKQHVYYMDSMIE